jgi:hypothetical protein
MSVLFLNENIFCLGLKFLKSTNRGKECWLTSASICEKELLE